MSAGQTSLQANYRGAIVAGSMILFLFSCGVVPKNYPRNKPFVYEYNINIHGNFSADEKTEMESRLANQLDDSIRVRTARKFFYRGINRPVLDRPPVWDSTNADKSLVFMKALLNSLGYFRDTMSYHISIDTIEDQYRVTVNFEVEPRVLTTLDSISYNIKHPELQQIAMDNIKDSYLKKGGAFAKAAVAVELDRLVDLYRDTGYLRFSRDELIGLWDTLDVSLLQPTLDPFEQLQILQKLKERQEHPTANIEIRLRPGFDSTKLTKYYIGAINVYPDHNSDTIGYTRKEVMVGDIKVIYYRRLFKPKIFPQNIYFHSKELYNRRKYSRTINRFNSLGAWRLTSIEPKPRPGQDTVDFNIRLTPAQKYSFTTNLEGSYNQNAASGNLFGIGINLGLQNRNFAKAANQATTNLRYGIELGDSSLIQTKQQVLSHNIYFPRAIFIRKWLRGKMRENAKTLFTFNAANTERKDLYNLSTLNSSFGYEFQLNRKTITGRYNIEFSNLERRPQLDTLFKYNPSLKNIFTEGFIESIIGNFTMTGGSGKNIRVMRLNLEKSGLLTTLLRKNKFMDTNLYRFFKMDAEFTWKFQFAKSALALRLFGGMGIESNNTVNPLKKNNLPFFKQYFAGGPNSMRAWGLRKLGPGSTIKDFTGSGTNVVPDRYGDVQLEGNIEYRFPLFVTSGVKWNGAVFTDIGNVWFLKSAAGAPEEVFKFSRLGKDIAVGTGIGLRIDFEYFVVRFDYSYKVKDPTPRIADAALQNKWFGYNLGKLKGTKFQLGISYPFIL